MGVSPVCLISHPQLMHSSAFARAGFAPGRVLSQSKELPATPPRCQAPDFEDVMDEVNDDEENIEPPSSPSPAVVSRPWLFGTPKVTNGRPRRFDSGLGLMDDEFEDLS